MNRIGNGSTFYLGCDVSLRSGGYAIIEVRNRQPYLIKTTTIKTDSKMTNGEALTKIHNELREFIDGYEFEEVIREKGFTRFNISTQQIFMSLGVVHFALYPNDIIEITPTKIKKMIGGSGKAEKIDIIRGVCDILELPESTFVIEPSGRSKKVKLLDDEADAVGVVLTHLYESGKIQ